MGTTIFTLSVLLLNQLPDTVSPNKVAKPVVNAAGSVLSMVMIVSACTESAGVVVVKALSALSLALTETAIKPSELSTKGSL